MAPCSVDGGSSCAFAKSALRIACTPGRIRVGSLEAWVVVSDAHTRMGFSERDGMAKRDAEEPGRNGPRRREGRPTSRRPGPRSGAIRLARVGGNDFELVHPRGVRETELDYEEGLEIWKAGDPEGARDALRYALSACRDNLWIHNALGRIALEEFRDPTLARGHFGYAVELGRKALPPQFAGRLPPDRPANRPFYDAVDGLMKCLDALGQTDESRSLRSLRDRLAGGPEVIARDWLGMKTLRDRKNDGGT